MIETNIDAWRDACFGQAQSGHLAVSAAAA
jgi:hypothetical protein